ncbi:hypothetical protein E3U47_24765 [Pseudomonas sp. RIT623]|nr:hypothetical protein E3U47_24765 [Pseudomonas sp. RIT623]
MLNGVSIKMPGRPRSGLDSIGNTAVRVATGGRAPYTYSSNNSAIASVTAQGKVVGERNGSATITVRDASGQSVSYGVQVSNVLQVILDRRSYNNAAYLAWARSSGGVFFTAVHWNDLRRVYTRPFDVYTWTGNNNFWHVSANWLYGNVPAAAANNVNMNGAVLRPL